MTSNHVFLSYASVEVEFALKLVASLKNAGVSIWMDRFDIRLGEDWRKSIQTAINDCAGMVAVVSPQYVSREYCLKELARANDLNLPILPLLLQKVDREALPLVLQGLQYIDFSNWRNELLYQERFNKLLRELKHRYKEQIGEIPSVTTQYLNSLIADLEAYLGVLEYVEISGHLEEVIQEPLRPEPEKLLEAGLSLLIDEKNEPILSNAAPDFLTATRRTNLKDIREARDKQSRFVLIGAPGSGKTTTIRRLALETARSHLDDPVNSKPLPIFIRLASWADDQNIHDYIRAYWRNLGITAFDPIDILARGDAFLFLDGLNEMGSKGKEKTKQIAAWMKADDAPKNVIITCRANEYTSDFDLSLPIVTANELNDDQIRKFVDSYLGATAEALLQQVLPRGYYRKTDSRSMPSMARNPYLLTALIIIFQRSPDQRLPSNNGTLFSKLIAALWERENLRRTEGWIPMPRMELAFSRLAFAMAKENTSLVVSRDFAIKQLSSAWALPFNRNRKAQALLDVGLNANLIEFEGDSVRFYHQLVQEYFAALGVKYIGVEKVVPVAHVGRWGWYLRDKWESVVITLAGLRDSELTIQKLMNINPYLAAVCISTGVIVSENTLDELGERLVGALHDKEDAGVRTAAAKALGMLKYPKILSELTNAINDWNTDVVNASIVALGEVGSSEAYVALVSLLGNRDAQISATAARVLQCDPTNAEIPTVIEAWLNDPSRSFQDNEAYQIARGLDHTDECVRFATATALGTLRNKRVLSLLLSLIDTNDEPLRDHAIFGLILSQNPSAMKRIIDLFADERQYSLWSTSLDPITGESMSSRVDVPNSPSDMGNVHMTFRRPYGRMLARYANHCLPVLTESLKHANPLVRLGTILALQEMRDSAVISCLKAMLNDTDSRVRLGAATALQKHGWVAATPDEALQVALASQDWFSCVEYGDFAVKPLRMALKDADANVRRGAIESLAKMLGKDASNDIENLLGDSDPHARSGAVKAFEIISDRDAIRSSLKDANSGVRRTAVEALERIGETEDVERIADLLVTESDLDMMGVISRTLKKREWQPITIKQRAAFRVGLRELRDCSQISREELPDLVAYLQIALEKEEWIRRFGRSLAICISELGDARAVPVLVRMINRSREKPNAIYRMGLECLTRYETAEVREILASERKFLHNILHDQKQNRHTIIDALSFVGDSQTAAMLVSYLLDPQLSQPVSNTLRKIGDKNIIPKLLELLSMAGSQTGIILDVLENIGGANGLLAALRDFSHGSYWAIAQRLVHMKTDITNELVESLQDQTTIVRGFAAYVIGERKIAPVAGTLLPLLAENTDFVRYFAAEALGKLRYKPSVAALTELVNDNRVVFQFSDVTVSDAALAALKLIASSETETIEEKIG